MTSLDAVARTFAAHHEHHRRLPLDVVERDRCSERELSNDYAGRVVYELFQNAVDRASATVVIDLAADGAMLRVANDGLHFRVNPRYRPDEPGQDRMDFHALCSLHTSAKRADRSIGNKGVGFRSVFTVAARAAVWSRADDGGWWGLELCRPGQASSDGPPFRAGAELVARLEGGAPLGPVRVGVDWPSFYFPAPLVSSSPSAWGPATDLGDTLVTVVEVPIDPDRRDAVRASIAEFARAPLHFVGLRYPDRAALEVEIRAPDLDLRCTRRIVPEAGWVLVPDPATPPADAAELTALAAAADHDVGVPQVALAYPPEAPDDTIDARPVLVGYLPTATRSGFGVQVQADFLLGTARTQVTVGHGDGTAVERYNTALLRAAGRLHVAALAGDIVHLEAPGGADRIRDRDDLFSFLAPQEGDAVPLRDAVRDGLSLVARDWRPWAALARRHFGTSAAPRRRKMSAFRAFWQATESWIWRGALAGYRKVPDTAKRDAVSAVAAALRDADAAVLPAALRNGDDDLVTGEACSESVPLVRSARRIFVRRPEDHDTLDEAWPVLLVRAHRVATRIELPELFRTRPELLGLSRWDRWDILGELRQPVLGDPEPPDDRHQEQAVREQAELLRFALSLWRHQGRAETPPCDDPSCAGPAWRRRHADERRRRQGEALATVHLPVLGGGWLPAAQVIAAPKGAPWLEGGPPEIGVLDLPWLLCEVGPDAMGLARFLGAEPVLPVVDGGRSQLAPRRATAPPIANVLARRAAAPHVDWAVLPSTLLATERDPAVRTCALVDALAAVGDELVDLRSVSGPSGSALDALCADRWFPVGEGRVTPGGVRFARRPGVVAGHAAPAEVVLREGRGGLRVDSLLSVEIDDGPPGAFLRRIGIVPIGPETPASKIRALLEALEANPAGPPPDSGPRQHYRELFGALLERLLARVVSFGDPLSAIEGVPLLVALGGPGPLERRRWTWVRAGPGPEPPAVAESRAVLSLLERTYATVPVVVGAVDRARRLWDLTRLPSTSVVTRVCPEQDPPGLEPASRTARSRLEKLLPALLALAEADGRAPDPVRAARDWSGVRIAHVEDTWLEHDLRVGDACQTRDEHARTWDDVFTRHYDGGRRAQDVVLFDTAPGAPSGALPPLDHFGRALAEILLRDQTARALFEQALTLADVDGDGRVPGERLARMLARSGAGPHLPRMTAAFRPLDEDQRAQLRDAFRVALLAVGVRCRELDEGGLPTVLEPSGLACVGEEAPTAEAIREEVTGACRALGLEAWAPDVRIAEANLAAWRAWLEPRRSRLLGWLLARDVDRVEAEREFRVEAIQDAIGRLSFSPPQVAVARIDALLDQPSGLDPERLDEALPSVIVAPVRVIATCAEAGWVPAPFGASEPGAGPERTTSADARRASEEAMAAVGLGAEEAVLAYALDRTIAALEGDAARTWSALAGVLRGPAAARLRADATAAWGTDRARAALARLLHVSTWRENAGYDVLLAERRGSEVVVVRLEVKSVAAEGVREVHVSRNQLEVARRVRAGEGGRFAGEWNLVAVVRGDGASTSVAVDVTEILAPLLVPGGEHPLLRLAKDGVHAEAFRLRLRRVPVG